VKKRTADIQDTFWSVKQPLMTALSKDRRRYLPPSYWKRVHLDWKFWTAMLSTTILTAFYVVVVA